MSTAFTGAYLITGDGRDYPDATVKVEGNRIVEVENGGAVAQIGTSTSPAGP
jgi:hypothetical protein